MKENKYITLSISLSLVACEEKCALDSPRVRKSKVLKVICSLNSDSELLCSVVDLIWILDLGSWMTHPTTKKEGGGICFLTFYCCHKFHKIGKNSIKQGRKKKFEPMEEEFKYFLPQKLSLGS